VNLTCKAALQTKQDLTEEGNFKSQAKKIAEILGMLAEGHRDSDWLLKEIKRHHLKIPSKTTLNSFEILNCCSNDFIINLHRALKGEDISGFGGVQPLTKTYHWLFTDIVGGSNPTTPTREQVRKITVLNELMARTETFRKRDPRSTVILPVGDGVAIGFDDSAERPLHLAVELHKALYRYNQSKKDTEDIFIRIGIDMGPVYFVKDLNGKDNVWGPGIILTRRVMDLCGPMNIFASARIADDMRKLSPEYGKILHPIGNHSIKHGEELYIYNIYGTGFGNKAAPRKAKIASVDLERDLRKHNNFSFNEIELKLQILDSKTWLTRHTLVWKVVNESKEPMQQIFYSLDGDIPKEFGDLNVSVKDDHDNTLEILAVNVNKPVHKEFNVQFKKPLKPKQKKTIILQYDWEEPERSHFYNLASGCKRFHFYLTANKQAEIVPKILKIDAETGTKIDASPPPSITNDNNTSIVDWSRNDLISDEAYQFIW
jgi:class 3 adenylate cyclase